MKLPTLMLGAGDTALAVDFLDNVAAPERRKGREITVRKVTPAQVSALVFRMLTIGDSLSDWNGTVTNAVRRLMSQGANISMLGTLMMGSIVGDAALAGEARGGKKFADYTNITTAGDSGMLPIAAGDEATYNAMDSGDGGRGAR